MLIVCVGDQWVILLVPSSVGQPVGQPVNPPKQMMGCSGFHMGRTGNRGINSDKRRAETWLMQVINSSYINPTEPSIKKGNSGLNSTGKDPSQDFHFIVSSYFRSEQMYVELTRSIFSSGDVGENLQLIPRMPHGAPSLIGWSGVMFDACTFYTQCPDSRFPTPTNLRTSIAQRSNSIVIASERRRIWSNIHREGSGERSARKRSTTSRGMSFKHSPALTL